MITTDYSNRTCIMVGEIEHNSRPIIMGLVVDGVSEVADIKGEEIEGAPDCEAGTPAGYIQGMPNNRESQNSSGY